MQGDLHNFGRRVIFGDQNGQSAVFKPRTTYWERFFFSKEGILQCFQGTSIESKILSLQQIERLDQSEEGDWIRQLKPASGQGSPHELWDQFTYLTAIASWFGIVDLLHENLIVTDTGICPIDVECVFHLSHNVFDTALLINRNTNPLLAGINCIPWNKENRAFLEKNWLNIFNNFELFFELACLNLGKFTSFASDHFQEMKKVPIRKLLKNSFKYAANLDGSKLVDPNSKDSDLIPEEALQIQRGDIPHFFNLIGDPKTYYYTSPDLKNYQPVHDQNVNALLRFGSEEELAANLLNEAFMMETILPANLLQWMDNLLLFLPEGTMKFPIQLKHYKIDVEGELLSVQNSHCEWIMTMAAYIDGKKQTDPRIHFRENFKDYMQNGLMDLNKYSNQLESSPNFLLMRVK